jgi:hypothetical protein
MTYPYFKPRRSFILDLVKNCPEAKVGLDAWQEGKATFEEAMMTAVHWLFMTNEELQRKLDLRPLTAE